jgi:hypothetical protein
VKQGVVQALAKSLVHFKVYDQVLTEIYKFCGPSFNFEFVRDVLAALDNIVNVGEMEAEEKQKLNQVSHCRTRSPPTYRTPCRRRGGA